jgi:hypothetical protein
MNTETIEKKSFFVTIFWGESQTRQENDPCTYEFATSQELEAFLLGVDEANGWMDYEIVDIVD